VPRNERNVLVEELFSIITGKVKDFVFKHDSVRVIQCALKYANPEQKKLVMGELKGAYRELAESRYAKFLVAKLVVSSDEARDVIVGEMQGGVKKLIKHPEAGWIVDDVYRGACTEEQRGRLLREWYGPEFVVLSDRSESESDLGKILERNPEKRGPIMGHLKEMINPLVQKKTTGFTMLHDAMLQYFLNTKVGSPEQTEFLEMLKDDEEGDCMRNLAFTKSGSRIVCLSLAYGNAKDRRNVLRFFKTHIRLMAGDENACRVLLTAYEVIDDTVMSAKAIFPELLAKDMGEEDRNQELSSMVNHVTPRMALLYPMASEMQRWLVTEEETKVITEIREIRKQTSKKEPEKRRTELVTAMSQPLLDFIASQVETLAMTSFGCQYMAEVLLGGIGDKEKAFEAILDFVEKDSEFVLSPAFGRMLKTLVQGGRFDPATKTIVRVEPALGFHNKLYSRITAEDEEAILTWANGGNSFVVLSMLEAPDFGNKRKLKNFLLEQSETLDTKNAGAVKIMENIGRRLKGLKAEPGSDSKDGSVEMEVKVAPKKPKANVEPESDTDSEEGGVELEEKAQPKKKRKSESKGMT
jgi:pumilio homology domain family member 6